MTDGGHRALEPPEAGHEPLEVRAAQVLAHPLRVAAGEEQAIVLVEPDERLPRQRLLKVGILEHLTIEGLGLGIGAELPEDDPGEEQRICCGRGPGLGGEDHLDAGVREQPPGHGGFGDVEVVIGQRAQHAHVVSPVGALVC